MTIIKNVLKNVIVLNRSSVTLHADQKGSLILIWFQNKDMSFFFLKQREVERAFSNYSGKYTLRDLRHAQTKLM